MHAMALALRLVLVYPGAPGSPQEAQEFLVTLGRYLERRSNLPAGGLEVTFYNDAAAGLAEVRRGEGCLAVVTLPALCGSTTLPHRYLCSPQIAGRSSETVSLVAKGGTPESDPATLLPGKRITGPLTAFPAFVGRLVLEGKADAMAGATVVPAASALLAVKALREGQADVALLTQSQVEALGGMVSAGTLTTLWTSPPIPGAPLISVGKVPEGQAAAVTKAFLGMCSDPEGAELCDTMGVTGFDAQGAAALAAAVERCWTPAAAPAPR